jgi:glycosyltransferase 2 family protein
VIRRILLACLGFALGFFCLWLSMRNVDWREALHIFRSADASHLAFGIALFGADIMLRALRWQAILAFRTPVTAAMSLQALLAGYAVNSILPARLGEIFRAHYLGRKAGVSRSAALASIVIERLLDLISVVASLAIGLALAGGGDSASRSVLVGGAVVALLAVLMLVAAAWLLSRRSGEELLLIFLSRLPGGAAGARRLGAMLGDFTQTLQLVRTRNFLVAVAFTLPIWALEARAMWELCRSIDISLGLAGILALMGGACLSTLMPTAPGYVGSYQIAFVVVLGQFGIRSTSAVVAATAMQVYLIGTYTLVGLAILATSALLSSPRRH